MKQPNHLIGRLVSYCLLLIIGMVIGYFIAIKTNTSPTHHESSPIHTETKEILYWYDPMKPDQHFDKPGKSPFMDMELVPKYADAQSTSNGIRIDPRITQNLNVRLGVVEKVNIAEKVDNAQANDIFTLQENINKTTTTTPNTTKTHEGLVVPSEAVIATGKHTLVIMAKANGYFEPREVVVGQTQNGKTEILSGLHEGDNIVISGQFLIDSEANFSSAINRMRSAGETP